MKKSSRQKILVSAIALHGKFFRWAAVSAEYKPLMLISISLLNTHLTRTQLALEKNVQRVRHYLRAIPYIVLLNYNFIFTRIYMRGTTMCPFHVELFHMWLFHTWLFHMWLFHTWYYTHGSLAISYIHECLFCAFNN